MKSSSGFGWKYDDIRIVKSLPKKRNSESQYVRYGYVVEFNFPQYHKEDAYRFFFINLETASTFMICGRRSFEVGSCGILEGMVFRKHIKNTLKQIDTLYILDHNLDLENESSLRQFWK